MKAIKNRTPFGHRRSDELRLVVGSCLMSGLLTLGGCSFLDTVRTRTAAPDDRAQLGWQDGTLFLQRGELDDYVCVNGLALQCESVSGRSLCHCPQR